MTDKKPFKFTPYILVFLGTFLILQIFMPPEQKNEYADMGDFYIETKKSEYAMGKDLKVSLYNNTEEDLSIQAPSHVLDCEPSFIVYKYSQGAFADNSSWVTNQNCDTEATWINVKANSHETIILKNQSYTQFGELGRYKIALEANETLIESPEFQIKKPGIFTQIWRNVIYAPMLNALVAILAYIPGHQLFWGVVILTLIIRTLLLVPSQKGFEAQQRMQEVQPKLEELKKKHKDDQARLAQETMLLWKTNNVHPLSSCLPVLIQLPIFLALYYVIQAGLSPDKSIFIYQFLTDFDLSLVDPMFIGWDLFERNIIILPVIVGVLQFIQMQMMMPKKTNTDHKMAQEIETATKMMRYMMPLMIAFFTAQLPAAVGIYWATNTIYGIIQQLVVKKIRPKNKVVSKNDDVTIKVIKKKNGKSN